MADYNYLFLRISVTMKNRHVQLQQIKLNLSVNSTQKCILNLYGKVFTVFECNWHLKMCRNASSKR